MLMNNSISVDGKEFISAIRAAKKIGYASDYVGQLCRAKKIPGRLIGRTWYVDFESLLEHKRNHRVRKIKNPITDRPNDVLPVEKIAEIIIPKSANNLIITYEKDDRPRLPELLKKIHY